MDVGFPGGVHSCADRKQSQLFLLNTFIICFYLYDIFVSLLPVEEEKGQYCCKVANVRKQMTKISIYMYPLQVRTSGNLQLNLIPYKTPKIETRLSMLNHMVLSSFT